MKPPLGQPWSRKDTDLLFSLCDRYQLKFIVICDRFNHAKEEEARLKLAPQAPKSTSQRKRDRKCKEKEEKKVYDQLNEKVQKQCQ